MSIAAEPDSDMVGCKQDEAADVYEDCDADGEDGRASDGYEGREEESKGGFPTTPSRKKQALPDRSPTSSATTPVKQLVGKAVQHAGSELPTCQAASQLLRQSTTSHHAHVGRLLWGAAVRHLFEAIDQQTVATWTAINGLPCLQPWQRRWLNR